ncbi:MAG: 16S rRNA (guanine(527)-N(7))-methyltransferase RsmG [Rubrivivax sp.]
MAHDPRLAPLRAGLDALALDVSPQTIQQLLEYLDLLGKWNRHYNLTSVRDPQQMLYQHLLDCLAVVPALDRHLQRRGARLLDVGSGAGLPGVVLAIMRPEWAVCCVDAVAKKASFVRQVAGELSLKNLSVEHARVERLPAPPCDIVISRAFASLADFTNLTRRHLAPGGCWLAMKGHDPTAERAALPGDVEMFHVEQIHVPGLQAQRCLVWMRPA